MPKVTILGCGGSAGVPHIGGPDGRGDWGACDPAEPRNRRTRSSIVVEGATGERLLVDASPDMREQLLACAIPGIDAVLFTHPHADHVLGIDDIRILNRIANRPLDAYAEAATMAELHRRFDYAFKAFDAAYFFRPVLVPHVISFGAVVEAAGVRVQTFKQDHGVMPTLGLRIGAFGYSTDVVRLDDLALSSLADLDVWVVDCFQRRPHITHAHVDQVIAWFEQVKPRRMVLTHMGNDLDWSWLRGRLPPGMEPGFDGLRLDTD